MQDTTPTCMPQATQAAQATHVARAAQEVRAAQEFTFHYCSTHDAGAIMPGVHYETPDILGPSVCGARPYEPCDWDPMGDIDLRPGVRRPGLCVEGRSQLFYNRRMGGWSIGSFASEVHSSDGTLVPCPDRLRAELDAFCEADPDYEAVPEVVAGRGSDDET